MFKKIIPLLMASTLFGATTNNFFRLSYQNLHFQNENLGLLETSYLFDLNNFYAGIGVYSAVNGKRGGFFTGGLNFGYKFDLGKIYFDNGVFIGGGGGGAAPQGSGLMLKIYSGILYKLKNYNVGINYNKIKFKDGSIDSNQIGFLFDYKFKDIYFLNKPLKLKGRYGVRNFYFKPFINKYFPINCKNTNNTNQKSFITIGAEFGIKNENYFSYLSAAGALKGDSDGYAEYLYGIGKKFKYITLKAALGAAGGGKVKTNGGVVYKLEAQKEINNFSLSAGYISALKDFRAYYLNAGYHKKFNFISPGNRLIKFKTKKFKIKIYNESYLPSRTIRKNSDNTRLDNLNVDVGEYINKYLFLFINASAAYNGGSGGYATGMLGAQVEKKGFFFNTAIGAAGGGNVDVGGGIIVKSKIGYKYKNLFLSFGRIKALEGRLNTYILSFGIDFDFYKGFID